MLPLVTLMQYFLTPKERLKTGVLEGNNAHLFREETSVMISLRPHKNVLLVTRLFQK